MGETSGYFSDPRSSYGVLSVVNEYFNLNIDMADLKLRSEEIGEITSQIKEEEKKEEKKEDLGYIG